MATETRDVGQTSAEVADAMAVVLEARGDEAGRRAIEATLIRPGRSANGLAYAEEVLRASLPLWEGAAAFLDHPDALDLTRAGQRSLRDLVGVYDRVRYEDGVRARLAFYPNAAWAYDLVAAAIADRAAGRPVADIGISADMRVVRRRATDGWAVERITRVVSADLVFQPSAGGAFDRVVEARISTGGEDVTQSGAQSERTSTAARDREAVTPSDAAGPGVEAAPRRDGTPAAECAAGRRDELLARLERDVAGVEEARRSACRELLGLKLAASGLPEPARAALRRELEGRAFEAEELDRRIEGLRARSGRRRGSACRRSSGCRPRSTGCSTCRCRTRSRPCRACRAYARRTWR
jgi:hypothetical protein